MRVEERSLESAGAEGCFAFTIAELGLHPGVPVAFRETILVVEDDDFVRDVTCELLRESGYEVLSAESAAVARFLFSVHCKRLDLLLCDAVLPDENGENLARALRRISRGLRVVLVSGYLVAEGAQGLRRRRATRYLQKPYSASSLMAEIRCALKRNTPSKGACGHQSRAR